MPQHVEGTLIAPLLLGHPMSAMVSRIRHWSLHSQRDTFCMPYAHYVSSFLLKTPLQQCNRYICMPYDHGIYIEISPSRRIYNKDALFPLSSHRYHIVHKAT